MVEVKALKKLLPENEIGAHPIDVLTVRGDILIQIPFCDSYNPITRTNWDEVGVIPNIHVLRPKTNIRKMHCYR